MKRRSRKLLTSQSPRKPVDGVVGALRMRMDGLVVVLAGTQGKRERVRGSRKRLRTHHPTGHTRQGMTTNDSFVHDFPVPFICWLGSSTNPVLNRSVLENAGRPGVLHQSIWQGLLVCWASNKPK